MKTKLALKILLNTFLCFGCMIGFIPTFLFGLHLTHSNNWVGFSLMALLYLGLRMSIGPLVKRQVMLEDQYKLLESQPA